MSRQSKSLKDIPVGHYHRAMESGHPIRRAWHLLKFTRVLEVLPSGPGLSLIDVGCFAGSFLSLAPETRFSLQLGVDILPEQIDFANAHFGTSYRTFEYLSSLTELGNFRQSFDCATAIEVIEHLTKKDIYRLFAGVARLLKPETGAFVLSTPNYTSTWPAIEEALKYLSDVDYSEQHITKFNYFNLRSRLESIVPWFSRYFRFGLLTTTHWLSPFAAVFGLNVATRLGSIIPYKTWRFPFGNLILVRLVRTAEPWDPSLNQ